MTKCKICGYEHSRKLCPFCIRLDRWGRTELDRWLEKVFPKRIRHDLKRIPMSKEKLERILESMNGRGLYIHGPTGCGKTILSANLTVLYATRRWLENKAIQVHFQTVPNLLQEIKQTFKPDCEQTEGLLVNKLSTTPWLVLDDLGVEKVSEWVLQTLYVIINNRYESMLPTIITSNLSLDDLSVRLGNDRIPSRIAGMCEILEMSGKDKRIRKEED